MTDSVSTSDPRVEVCPECGSQNFRVADSRIEHQTVFECLEPMCAVRWFEGCGGVMYPLFVDTYVEAD